jgi:hypothetical protein
MCPQNEAMFGDCKRKGQLFEMVDRRELSRFPKNAVVTVSLMPCPTAIAARLASRDQSLGLLGSDHPSEAG